MMALEKERERRYPSSGALASDISRYLAHEPVRASPPSTTYRFRKFARRNRFVLSTATLLVLGLSVMVYYGFRTAQLAQAAESLAEQRLLAEQLAHDEAKKARAETNLQRLEADQQRGRAEANLVDARAALDQILLPILDQPESGGPIAVEVRNAMLREALRFYELFLERNAADPQLRAETARASGRVASVHSSLGELEPAEQAARRTVQLFGSLTDQFGAQSAFANELADSLSTLARILRERNVRLAEAESLLLEAIKIRDQRLAEKPVDGSLLVSLANDLHDLGYLRAFYGKPASAESPLMRCIAIEQQLTENNLENEQRVVLLSHRINSLGIFLRQTRRSKEAEQMHRRALKLIEEWTNRAPGRVQPSSILSEYVRSVTHLALALEMQMELDESEELTRQVIGLRQASLGEALGNDTIRAELALTMIQLAGILEKQSRWELANNEYQRAFQLIDPLCKSYPQLLSYQYHRLSALRRWGNLAVRQKQSDLARQRFELLAMCPTDTAQSKSTMAWHFCTCGLTDLRDADRALELARAASAETPEDGRAWAVLGMALYRNDLVSEAKPILEKANNMLDSAGDNSAAYFNAMVHWKQGETQVALELWRDIDPKWDSQRADMLEMQACRKEAATLLGVEFEIP